MNNSVLLYLPGADAAADQGFRGHRQAPTKQASMNGVRANWKRLRTLNHIQLAVNEAGRTVCATISPTPPARAVSRPCGAIAGRCTHGQCPIEVESEAPGESASIPCGSTAVRPRPPCSRA
ncbi:MAG: hypothetical protein ACLTZY_02895 [Alistipes indistinctus]